MSARFWQDQIKLYDKEFEDWTSRSKKVIDRYLDKRGIMPNGVDTVGDARFNILWANVETIFPAVYNRIPKPDVSRRYKDKDPAGRVASLLLERCLEYEIEQYSDFDSSLKNCLYDRLLPGRGIAWVRYEPTFIDGESVTGQVTEDETQQSEDGMTEQESYLAKECAPIDYVNWQDFGHSCAKTWEEVRGVWRRVLMDKDALETRFGEEKAKQIPIDNAQADLEGIPEARQADHKKAAIYEVWDKQERKVYWIAKGVDEALDERDDPLKLNDFFPCPKPIFSTISTSSLIPVPDYAQYQDQAIELDNITNRIGQLIRALKVVGVYDSSQDGLKRLMSEGTNNTLIPVTNWAMFGEKGGLKGAVDFFPLDMVVAALQQSYVAREQIKQVIYEITGIADILRGQSQASETATAQQIKANYAGLRIKALQQDVARFARDLIRLKAEIICEFFSDETIINMSGAMFLSEEDQMHVGQALQLLRDDVTRNFRVDIESDSMVEADEAEQKQAATELLTGTADFMQRVTPAVQQAPELAPLLLEVFMFTLRRYKVGKTIEGQYQETFDKVMEKLNNPQPQANPEDAQMQAQAQQEQMRMQAQQQSEMMKTQAEAEREGMRGQLESAKLQATQQLEQIRMQHDADMEARRQAFEEWKVKFTEENKIRLAKLSKEPSDPDEDEMMEEQDKENKQDMIIQAQQQIIDGLGQLAEIMQRPRVKELEYDANGDPVRAVERLQ